MDEKISENLLTAWLRVSAGVRNERLVRTMTFNEVFVCNILYAETVLADKVVTATDICVRTGMLKSQANKVLVAMEDAGLIVRARSEADRRKVILRLTDEGVSRYINEHRSVLKIMEMLTDKLGSTKISLVSALLTEVADTINIISKEI